ncbi:hypothetical protein J6590_088192 [Homalodisca vitripennis]|nr:hypothetical protein J6590_088192 [Homalodisca vitripennis]
MKDAVLLNRSIVSTTLSYHAKTAVIHGFKKMFLEQSLAFQVYFSSCWKNEGNLSISTSHLDTLWKPQFFQSLSKVNGSSNILVLGPYIQ